VKERETGSEFEGIGWSAHQTLDGNTGLQLLRHSRGDFFVAGAQNGIAEVFAAEKTPLTPSFRWRIRWIA
jgi:hypothetical protein